MVKPATLVLTALSVVAPLVSAEACTNNLNYCGYNLLNKGNYYAEILAELRKHKFPTTEAFIKQSLFTCGVGGNGWIGLAQVCSKCTDGGSGRSDYCKNFPT